MDGRSDSVFRLRNSSDLAARRRDASGALPELDRNRMFICMLEPDSCSCFLVSVLLFNERGFGGGIIIRRSACFSVWNAVFGRCHGDGRSPPPPSPSRRSVNHAQQCDAFQTDSSQFSPVPSRSVPFSSLPPGSLPVHCDPVGSCGINLYSILSFSLFIGFSGIL